MERQRRILKNFIPDDRGIHMVDGEFKLLGTQIQKSNETQVLIYSGLFK